MICVERPTRDLQIHRQRKKSIPTSPIPTSTAPKALNASRNRYFNSEISCALYSHFRHPFGQFFQHYLITFWLISGQFLASSWPAFGQLLASFWPASGQLLASFWPASGQLLASFWPVFGSNLDPFWGTSKKVDFQGGGYLGQSKSRPEMGKCLWK